MGGILIYIPIYIYVYICGWDIDILTYIYIYGWDIDIHRNNHKVPLINLQPKGCTYAIPLAQGTPTAYVRVKEIHVAALTSAQPSTTTTRT